MRPCSTLQCLRQPSTTTTAWSAGGTARPEHARWVRHRTQWEGRKVSTESKTSTKDTSLYSDSKLCHLSDERKQCPRYSLKCISNYTVSFAYLNIKWQHTCLTKIIVLMQVITTPSLWKKTALTVYIFKGLLIEMSFFSHSNFLFLFIFWGFLQSGSFRDPSKPDLYIIGFLKIWQKWISFY